VGEESKPKYVLGLVLLEGGSVEILPQIEVGDSKFTFNVEDTEDIYRAKALIAAVQEALQLNTVAGLVVEALGGLTDEISP